MDEISVRDLRNDGGRILDRVEQGEALLITRSRRPVAELRPLAAKPLAAAVLLERWKGLPPVDADALRADLDAILDTGL